MRDLLYTVERIYPVELDILWRAWVDPEALNVWYSPTSLSVAEGTVESDPVIGGTWSVGVDVPEHNFVALFFGKYTQVIEHELLEHTMNYTQSWDEFKQKISSPLEHLVRVEFKSVTAGTQVSFTQFGELPEGEAPRAKSGMESYFDNLGRYLEVEK